MKRTQFKDALRNIGKQRVSYLSIIVIAFLGVTTFLGIDYSDGALRVNGSNMYNAVNYRDVEIVSTLLLTEEDLDTVLALEGVQDAEPVWQTGAKVSSGETKQEVAVISLTERINLPALIEGRLPETETECAVEERLAADMGWAPGNEIHVFDTKGGAPENLKENRFVITGIANHPDHTSTSIPDTLYILVQKDAFDREALDGCFMKAEVVIEKDAEIDRFGGAYEEAAAAISERLERTAASCVTRRNEEIRDRAQAQIKEGQGTLDDAEAALAEARMTLDGGWADLKKGEGELTRAEQELAEAKAALDNKENDLWAAKLELNEYQNALALGRAALDEAAASLSPDDPNYAHYLEGEALYNELWQQFSDAQAQYDYGLYLWYLARDQYWEGLEELEVGRTELEQARIELEQGESEYTEKLAEVETAAAELEKASRAADTLEEGRWILFDCRGNSSFVQLALGSSNLTSLEMTFSLLFVVVGALVIYATISKMIDEQRRLVGAGKALGLYNREIFFKYLLFGVSATLLGTVLGILAARFAMEVYVLKNTDAYYTFDTTTPTLIVRSTVIALAASALLSVSAVWFASTKLLRSTAIQLMQPRVPKGRKKAGKSGGHVLPLYSRLILLNIRTDIRRVLVTVVSVAGCCALVVIGFTLKSAVEGALVNQFTKIVDYDWRIKYDAEAAKSAPEEIAQTLRDAGADYTELYDGVTTFRVTENLVGELLCGDLAEISSFYHLLDWKTGEVLAPTDEGILVQKRTAESYDLTVGSELSLSIGGGRTVPARVAGIFDNYIGRVMLMSPVYYRELFGNDCPTNAFFIRLNGADGETLLESVRQIEGFESCTRADADRSLFASSSALVIAIVALFIFMAAVMAGIVLTNLTNIYILQKKPELTIMRVNGFTVREVTGYVLRETVITTILGILLGVAMGSGIAYKITRAMESVFIQYDRSISYPAWLYGAVITVFFAVVINALSLRQIRGLKLTDVT